jgi:tetratricopeptide (TPR) repeat protein
VAAVAAGTIGIAVAGFFAIRALGPGDAGTPPGGVLAERDRLVVAEFENHTTDSMLGPLVSEALRIDLAQSPAVRLLDSGGSEGAKAVVRGQIDPLGAGYVLAADLVAATDGAVRVSLRDTVRDNVELIDAVDRLSKRLRGAIGEPLGTIQSSKPLRQVATGSLDALRRYAEALRADLDGESDRAVTLLEQAIALDTGFALAHHKLAAVLVNTAGSPARVNAAAASAFRHRERLPPLERHLAAASYYSRVELDTAAVEEAYRAALDVDPDNFIAANNLATIYNDSRRFAAAESLGVHHRTSPDFSIQLNVVRAQLGQGKLDDAAGVARTYELQAPGHPASTMLYALIAENRDAFDSAEARLRSLRPAQRDLTVQTWQMSHLFALVLVRGKLRAAEAEARRFMDVSERRRLPAGYLTGAVWIGLTQVRFRGEPRLGRRTVAAALAKHPLATLPAEDRPYALLIMFLAEAGEAERARQLQTEYEAAVPDSVRRADAFRYAGAGALAFAEGRWDDALRAYRKLYDESSCARCGLYELARIYDQLGRTDSALVISERAVTNFGPSRVFDDAWTLAGAYKRLGELYEQRGDSAKARAYYGKFVDLWNDADLVLQPAVRDVRDRLEKLAAEKP